MPTASWSERRLGPSDAAAREKAIQVIEKLRGLRLTSAAEQAAPETAHISYLIACDGVYSPVGHAAPRAYRSTSGSDE